MIKTTHMDFKKAKEVSSALHFIAVMGIDAGTGFIFWLNYGKWGFLIGIAVALCGQFALIMLFNGCIFTHIENAVSRKKYGREFHPKYDITKSIMYRMINSF